MKRLRRAKSALLAFSLLAVLGGCPLSPPSDADVIVSILNVTDFEARVIVSGVVSDVADVGEETISPFNSTSVTFRCLDELVIGDPLDLDQPGARITVGEQTVELDPFILLAGQDFACGEIIEIIVSGESADTVALNVFVLTPP